MNDWRAAQKEQTRKRISRAVHELIAETGHVSVPAVAERSGVSPATIYRHFPNRDALIGSAAYEHVDTGIREIADGVSAGEYRALIGKVFAAHADDIAGVIAQHSTPAGREMRRLRLDDRMRVINQSIRSSGVDPQSAEGRRASALLAVIGSSRAFLEFHEMTDMTTDEAADAVAWAVNVIAEATIAEYDDRGGDER